ncbi:Gp15 family bacteriophage protein [Lysinibacillus sp. RS5]|uniref:Gp15 family bacteriophage protein n=1 Tax=unclassified Lysinibacillus TaxID=2636778 RepID=UPI0035BE4309
MFNLTTRRDDVIRWHGVDIDLNLAFDNVLLLFELFGDKSVSPYMKYDIAIEMLVINHAILKQLNGERIFELIKDILREKLNIDLDKKAPEPSEEDANDPFNVPIPTYDFTEDAEYIYASFLMDYNMDLFEQQGKLSWYKFIALFNNLSDETPMGKALHYRTCSVPKSDKHNADEIKRIRSMKEKYMLKSAKPLIEARQAAIYAKQLEARKKAYKEQQDRNKK